MRLIALAGVAVVLLTTGCGGGTEEFQRAQADQSVSAARIEATRTAGCGFAVSIDGLWWEELGVPVAFTPGRRLGPGVVPGCSDNMSEGVERPSDLPVAVVAIEGVDPRLAVAIDGDPKRVYLAPGADREEVLGLLVPGRA